MKNENSQKEKKTLEKRDHASLRPIDRFFFNVARTVGFYNSMIEAINKSRLLVVVFSIVVSFLIGHYFGHLWFTVTLVFLGLLLRTAYHFEFADFEDLVTQHKQHKKIKAQNDTNNLSSEFKKRIKWYLILFFLILFASLFQLFSQEIRLDTVGLLKIIALFLGGSLVAAAVVGLLIEYIYGLHRNRILNFLFISILVIYTLFKYVI